jgi:hypothetical protein
MDRRMSKWQTEAEHFKKQDVNTVFMREDLIKEHLEDDEF